MKGFSLETNKGIVSKINEWHSIEGASPKFLGGVEYEKTKRKELFITDSNGVDHTFNFSELDFPMREGNVVSVSTVIGEKIKNPVVGIYNHNSNKKYIFDGAIEEVTSHGGDGVIRAIFTILFSIPILIWTPLVIAIDILGKPSSLIAICVLAIGLLTHIALSIIYLKKRSKSKVERKNLLEKLDKELIL